MEIYDDELKRLVAYLSEGDDSKEKEIWESYEEFVFTELKIRHFNTHIALRDCKNFEEIAEEFTKKERKKKPLTVDAIRKRAENATSSIVKFLREKYEKK